MVRSRELIRSLGLRAAALLASLAIGTASAATPLPQSRCTALLHDAIHHRLVVANGTGAPLFTVAARLANVESTRSASLSPDGKLVAFLSEGEARALVVAGRDFRQVQAVKPAGDRMELTRARWLTDTHLEIEWSGHLSTQEIHEVTRQREGVRLSFLGEDIPGDTCVWPIEGGPAVCVDGRMLVTATGEVGAIDHSLEATQPRKSYRQFVLKAGQSIDYPSVPVMRVTAQSIADGSVHLRWGVGDMWSQTWAPAGFEAQLQFEMGEPMLIMHIDEVSESATTASFVEWAGDPLTFGELVPIAPGALLVAVGDGGSEDDLVELWEKSDGRYIKRHRTKLLHSGPVRSMTLVQPNVLLVTDERGSRELPFTLSGLGTQRARIDFGAALPRPASLGGLPVIQWNCRP